ncbi:hypothetical protein ACI7RC_03535 [Brevibacillus sp. B_LB10_24]
MTSDKYGNTKNDMGYNGSGMHGYTLHKKEGKIDKYAGKGTKARKAESE